jgi:hypothetical protein|nr:hypothetical protein [Neorhizobium tomejilense]
MATLTYGHVEAWAKENGFAIDWTDGRLKAPFRDAVVVIEPMKRDFRVVLEHDGNRRVLMAAVTPSKTHIDENGMLQGAGLFSYFHLLYLDQGDDGVLPVWFNERVREMIAESEPAARERRGFAPRL